MDHASRTAEQLRAYNDGWRSGHLDRSLGVTSQYAWFGVFLDPVDSYGFHYSLGYQTARRASA